MQRDALALEAVPALADDLGQLLVEGVAEAHMADHTLLEEGEGPHALGAVDDLVGHHEVARADLLLQRADGGEGDDGAHAEVAQGGDVGLVLDLVRRVLVVEAVAREEGDGHGLAGAGRVVLQDADGRRRLAPRRVDVEPGGEREAGQRRYAGAADHGDVDWSCVGVVVRLATRLGSALGAGMRTIVSAGDACHSAICN